VETISIRVDGRRESFPPTSLLPSLPPSELRTYLPNTLGGERRMRRDGAKIGALQLL
jgi:hypothetical protein